MEKRFLAILLAFVMLSVSLTACSSAPNQEEITSSTEQTTKKPTDNTNFKLSYTQGDSLDPFKAKTQNNQILSSLVFESLFDIDETYEVSANIATGYKYTDSRTIQVKFSPKLEFSNGDFITAEDIIYSFNAAKKSPAYQNALSGISYAEASSNIIYFHLSYDNPYAVNLLTFPIACVRDNKNGYPIGSGRYVYASNEGRTVLKANTKKGFDPYFTTINLVNIAAADSIDNAVNIGNISYAFRDLSSAVSKRISCAKKLVNMNNLVYLGMNSLSGICSNNQIRKAISLACDRSSFADTAYSGYAVTVTSPFNPDCAIAENVKIFSPNADITTARQAIAQSGIKAENLKLRILVNKNNNRIALATLLKSQLESVGFTVEIITENHKEYIRKIKNIEFDLYIGEVKLADDMNLYPFFSKNGGVRYGIDNEKMTCDELYSDFLSDQNDLGKFILAFSEEMPYIPLIYKKGMICYSKALNGDMQGYYGNFFSNIDSWNFEN